MKTLIKSIFATSLILSMVSCADDEDPGATGTTVGATVRLAETEISTFDINEELTLNLTGDAQITTISIVKKGQNHPDDNAPFSSDESIGNATVSGDVATFNTSSLLPFVFPGKTDGTTASSGSFPLDFLYEGGSISPAVAEQILTVNKVINITEEVSAIKHKDTASDNIIKYVAKTAGATIDGITVTWKNGSAGAETDISSEFAIASGEIDLKDRAYINDYGLAVGDTLIYTFTVTSGTLSDTAEVVIPIDPQPHNAAVGGTISNDLTTNQLSLLTGETSIDDAPSGDIEFDGTQGFKAIANTGYTVDIQFVKLAAPITGAAAYDAYNDVEQTKADFDAGAAVTTAQVVKDEIYVYKLVRNIGTEASPVLKDIYGVILVGDVTLVNGGTATSIALSAKENSIIE
ncbi:hypothetical protein [Aquimarina aquimarini]|uniref:hypothetical protein n=1 Tax=Aquimarina aquimarini TaxID=1191734 RepID=UPI00131F1B21|nr:hypothetical protein [Aquimarina aquimarini]